MQDLKQFYKYVVPSVCAMLMSALYYIVDGVVVGRGIGANGLAAVNLAWPFISVIIGLASMVMMGGATLCVVALGEGDQEKANKVFQNSMTLTVIFSLVLAGIAGVFAIEIATVLGATPLLLEDTASYIKYYNLFCVFFTSSMVLSVFVRNDGNPMLAFWGMILGALTNIFLDCLFVFGLDMGIKGAALASGLGQTVACIVLIVHFFREKSCLRLMVPKIEKKVIKGILYHGMPEFITQLATPITMLCYNLVVMKVLGEIGVSAYAVMGYVFMITISITIGVAQGVQPLIGRSFGKKDFNKEQYFFRLAMIFNVILSIASYILLLIFARPIVSIFSTDHELIGIAIKGFSIYGIAFIFMAFNVIYITYFYTTQNTNYALILSCLRGIVLNTVCIIGVPLLLGDQSLWLGIVVCEGVTTIIG